SRSRPAHGATKRKSVPRPRSGDGLWIRSDGEVRRQVGRDQLFAKAALGMAEGAGDEVDIVIAGRADAGRYEVELERVAELPGDDVVGAGGVPAHADGADQRAVLVIQAQPAAENVHAADRLADHRVVMATEV